MTGNPLENANADPPQVSIVVINHNYEAYLPAAIESALAQTWPNCQVIVVDDGSIDNSRAMISAYGNRVTPVFKPAGGHVSAANAGHNTATGNYVMFLDADDVLYPTCVATVLANWREGDIKLQFRLDTIDQAGLDQKMPFPYFAPDLTPEAVRQQAYRFGSYPWTVSTGNAYAKTFLDRLMPIDQVEIYRSPDGYLNKMAPLFGDVRSVSEILGAYRVHGANAWAQDQGGVRIEPVIRWLKFDQVLQACFEREAAAKHIAVRSQGNIHTTQHVEYRLLAKRFAPAQSPYADDTQIFLVQLGINAACVSPNMSLRGRVLWCAWFVVIGFAPKELVRWAFGMARTQRGRVPLVRFMVGTARGPARKQML